LGNKKLVKYSTHYYEMNDHQDLSEYDFLEGMQEKMDEYFRDIKQIQKMANLLIKKPSEIPLLQISKS
jgi:hypothetical protein